MSYHIGLELMLKLNISDGRKINELDTNEIKAQAEIIREKGLKNIVIIGICKNELSFASASQISLVSPLDINGRDEYKARSIFQQELGPDVNIVCSRDGMNLDIFEI